MYTVEKMKRFMRKMSIIVLRRRNALKTRGLLGNSVPVNVEIVFGLVFQHRAEVEAAFVHEKFNQSPATKKKKTLGMND